MFDVVVIGGNLAGATAAINAAEIGASAVLVERNKEPFSQAHCGEMLIDTEAELLNLDKIGCAKNEINTIKINISSKEKTFKLKTRRIIIFDRNFVEKRLLKEAEKSGVKLMLGIHMRDFKPPHEIILDNNEIIKGKIIIDASGIACQVGRRVGLDTKLKPKSIGVCIQSRVQSNFDANIIKSWFHKPYAPFGYAWLFPLNEKIANIGLGVPGGQKLDLAKLLKSYINDMTNGKYKINSTFRACVPSAPPMNRLIKDNVLITGDAARLAHPLSGGGIRNALFSGSLAGIIAAKYSLGEISSLEPYQDTMQTKILRLGKEYNFKCKISKNEDIFLRNFGMAISTICLIHRLFPNFLERLFTKFSERDKLILESYKESPFILK
ncbi:MAG: NAD(P)/FAD-dependent oxidoreductase [Thermoplasmatales archaeon]|nr:NAD(P)/FAD-dependent oxidoreductase [Thermoplasmatales archaeon]